MARSPTWVPWIWRLVAPPLALLDGNRGNVAAAVFYLVFALFLEWRWQTRFRRDPSRRPPS